MCVACPVDAVFLFINLDQEKGALPPFAKKQEYSRAYRVAYTAALAAGTDAAGAAAAGWAAVRTDDKGAGGSGTGGGGGSKAVPTDDDDGAILLSDSDEDDDGGASKRMRREAPRAVSGAHTEGIGDGAAGGGGGADGEADPFAGWDDFTLPAEGTADAPIELF